MSPPFFKRGNAAIFAAAMAISSPAFAEGEQMHAVPSEFRQDNFLQDMLGR